MTTAYAEPTLQDLPDGPGVLTEANDGQIMRWDAAAGRMVMIAMPRPVVLSSAGGGGGGGGPQAPHNHDALYAPISHNHDGVYALVGHTHEGGDDHDHNGTYSPVNHNHDDRYVMLADYTAADVLTKLLTVDGIGSGLDADLLDGLDSTAFAEAGHTHDTSHDHDADYAPLVHVHAGEDITSGTIDEARIASTITRDSEVFGIVLANDGPGSGLDADTLDGLSSDAFALAGHDHDADYAPLAHTHDAADITSGTLDDARIPSGIARDSEVFGIVLANDGAGSGLDADTLDGLNSTAFESAGTVATHAALTAAHGATGAVVGTTNTQTLTNKTLTTPVIASFANAGHDHTNAAGGGQLGTGALTDAAITNAKLANMAQATVKGRASGAGTGVPTDLTPAQVSAIVGSVPLDVKSSGTSTNPITATRSSNSNPLAIVRESSAGHGQFQLFDASDNVQVSLFAAGDSFLTGGSVGIGNAAPNALLHVGAGLDTYTTSAVAIAANAAGAASVVARNSANDVEMFMQSGSSSGFVGTATNHDLFVRTNNSNRMTILAGGNVGIGNTSPAYPLHVGAGADTLVRTETALAVQIAGNATIAARNSTNDVEAVIIAGSSSAFVGTATNHPLNILVNNATRATFTAAGDLGIGTSSPQGRLHAHDGTGGCLFAVKTGIVNSNVTIIPDGTGDVVRILSCSGVVRTPDNVVVNVISVSGLTPGSTVDQSYSGGADVIRFEVTAAGAFVVRRVVGSKTYEIAIWAVWM